MTASRTPALSLVNLSTGAQRTETRAPIVASIAARLHPRLARAWSDMVPFADEGELSDFRFTAALENNALLVSVTGPNNALLAVFVAAATPNPAAWQAACRYARESQGISHTTLAEPPTPWCALAYWAQSGHTPVHACIASFQSYLAWAWLQHPYAHTPTEAA